MGKRGSGWTRDDVRYLEANPTVPIRKLAAWLGRTEASVKQKRCELGLGRGRRWSEADTAFLRENQRMPVKEVARRLGKKESSVHNKRNAMGIKSHDWTDEEDRIVRMWHNRVSIAGIAAKLPGRTAMAVGIRVRLLGLRSDVFWTDGEVEFLRTNPGMDAAEAARTLGKTVHAVHHKRRGLGMTRKQTRKKWTIDEKALLTALTKGGEAAKDIAVKMDRTKISIQNMQRIMGLMTPRSERALQSDEEKFLRDHPDMPAVEIAKHIGRTAGAVRTWRRKIGLPEYQKHKRWTRDETEQLRANLQRPMSEIYALFPDRPKASVNVKVASLGRKRLRRKGHTYSSGYKHLVQRGGRKISEHRMVAEEKIGRPLRRGEEVHHINYIKHDNRPENLDVLENRSVHARMPQSINELVRILLEDGTIGYDPDVHSYFLPSRLFDLKDDNDVPASCRRMPEISYVFCGDRVFPFLLQPDMEIAKSLGELPPADSVLPIERRHAVALCGAAASPALLERYLGTGASPFPVVRGRIAEHDVVPVHGAAGAGRLVQDVLRPSSGASTVVWIALLDSRQIGAMDACAGRGRLCDMVEVHANVEFENGEGLSAVHSYVSRGGQLPVYGLRAIRGSPPRLSHAFRPLVRSRAGRRTG